MTRKYACHLEGEATKKAAKIFENSDPNNNQYNANDNKDLVGQCAACTQLTPPLAESINL